MIRFRPHASDLRRHGLKRTPFAGWSHDQDTIAAQQRSLAERRLCPPATSYLAEIFTFRTTCLPALAIFSTPLLDCHRIGTRSCRGTPRGVTVGTLWSSCGTDLSSPYFYSATIHSFEHACPEPDETRRRFDTFEFGRFSRHICYSCAQTLTAHLPPV
jgi:hypothetical protein